MKKLALLLCALLLISALCLPTYAETDYEMLENGDFEEHSATWQKYYMATVDYCDQAHSGSSALSITHRQHSTDIARQYITDELEYYGPGEYEFSAWVRLADPTDQPIAICVAIGVYCEQDKDYWFTSNFVNVTSEWTYISAKRYISWETELETAEFYLVSPMNGDEDTSKNFRDLILDDCSMKPVGFTGEPYAPPTTEAPTTVPETEAPTTEAPTTEEPTTSVETDEPTVETTTPEQETDHQNPDTEQDNANTQSGNQISTQTIVITCTMVAVALILLAAGIALTVSFVRGKRNEAGK